MTLFVHRNAGGRCPCGAANAACGPPSSVVPVDQMIEEVGPVSGPLKKYKVKRGDIVTVMKLSDADAARLGVGPDDVVGAASTIKPVAPADEEPQDDPAAPAPARKAPAKRRTASANKARTSSSTKADGD